LSAIGWRRSAIRSQVILENTVLAIIAVVAGLALAAIVAWLAGGIEITIDLPWDLSSTPHFLPEATLERSQVVFAPLEKQHQHNEDQYDDHSSDRCFFPRHNRLIFVSDFYLKSVNDVSITL